ncbi:MAG TPA: AAA family ATPase [Syntrophales bacterium]|nr:AAA family ATPase [Syntrophales bacterium]
MYKTYYGFKEKPFNMTPDPDYLFMSRGHSDTYTHLEYAIVENKGFVVITGEIGSGKTTLINFLLRRIKTNVKVGVLNQTMAQPKQFMKMICQEFGLETSGLDKAEMLNRIKDFLVKQFNAKSRVALIVDEAQNLPDKTIEEIRMLSNLESEKHHLIQIILVGQSELKDKLQQKKLEQFVQRVTVYCHLNGLDKDEVDQYIRHRLHVGGTKNLNIFDRNATEAIHRYSKGIPRLINIICDAALVYGYADELEIIGENVIEEVVKDRDTGGVRTKDISNRYPRSTPAIGGGITGEATKKFRDIEKRIDVLEKTLYRINKELDTLTSSKGKRDELALELTKMLQQSIKNRSDLLLTILKSEQKSKLDEKEVAQNIKYLFKDA